jgi:hypothetical protein
MYNCDRKPDIRAPSEMDMRKFGFFTAAIVLGAFIAALPYKAGDRSVQAAALSSTIQRTPATPVDPDHSAKGSVTGAVINSSSLPVEGASVELTDEILNEVKTTFSGKKGNFEFPKLLAGLYHVQAHKGSLKSDPVKIEVGGGPSNVQALQIK